MKYITDAEPSCPTVLIKWVYTTCSACPLGFTSVVYWGVIPSNKATISQRVKVYDST